MTTDDSSSSSLPYAIPSLEGYPTLHELSDAQAARHPDRPFYSYTNDDAPDTLIEISHLELNRATHRAAAKMSELPGYDAAARQVVAIVASTDTLVYVALFLGALRAGFVVSIIPLFDHGSQRLANVFVSSLSSCRLSTPLQLSSD